jgi:hypothetical protein
LYTFLLVDLLTKGGLTDVLMMKTFLLMLYSQHIEGIVSRDEYFDTENAYRKPLVIL